MKIFNLSFEKSVGAVIFRINEVGDREFLLLRYLAGHWGFPKGHVEKGETEEETLRREVEEEAGITGINILPRFKEKIRYIYRANGNEKEERERDGKKINVIKKVVFYIAQTTESDVRISSEHTEFEWLGYEEALARITYANSRRILKKAHNFLQK